MSWVPLHPEAAPSGAASPVTITVSSRAGRFRQKATLTIRAGAIEGLGDWCRPGALLSVERGEDAHAGMLRLTPHGPWRFAKPSGSIKAASVVLPPPAGAPDDGCRQVPVAFRHGPEWIEVTLPDWARAASAAARSSPNGRYVGISERVPDPAKAIQAANGARVR